jgi:hypothetical protein
MTYTNEQARELGALRGYLAADYAANVAGQPVREPAREDEPALTDDAWMHFKDGWGSGVEAFQRADSDDDLTMLRTPRGYDGVEHADGTVHAIDLGQLHDETPDWPDGMPMRREPPLCGTGTGVSSDEGGHTALHRPVITCWECVSILA